MRILHINAHDNVDGAGRAAHRLHTALLRRGHDSYLFVARKTNIDPRILSFEPSHGIVRRFRRRFRRKQIKRDYLPYEASRPDGYERFSDDRSRYGAEVLEQLPEVDLINLHQISEFIDYSTFFGKRLPRVPIVWTLHDMYPFTGGCHYDHGCGRFVDQCGACPQLGSDDRGDLSYQVWKRKRDAFQQVLPNHLHLVALNRWMKAQIEHSSLLHRFPVSVIPNSINVELFSPGDQGAARQKIGVSIDARIVLFVASSVENKRKGFALLVRALKALSDLPDLLLLSIGRGNGLDVGIPNLHLGVVSDDDMLANAYRAADVFVIPSLQDNLPNTVLEAFACGTPVVGFDAGGIPEVVRAGTTGFLAPVEDVEALSASIKELLNDANQRQKMRANCRRIAVESYSLNVQASCYSELYKQLLLNRAGISK